MAIKIEKNQSCWTIIISRLEARNAIDPAHAQDLYAAFLEFDADEQAEIAILCGEGGAFCAGYDLKHAAAQNQSLAPDDFNFDEPREGIASMAPMGPSRLQLNKPVIAAISGPAVAGGMELALWADLRVMEESAYMGVYCRRWGVPLVDGGTVRLPRLVGHGRAMDLILTGRQVNSDEALKIGLCEYVVGDGLARSKAEELANQIVKFPQNCMRSDRQSLNSQHGLSLASALENEWSINSKVIAESAQGASRFASGKGRAGDFGDI